MTEYLGAGFGGDKSGVRGERSGDTSNGPGRFLVALRYCGCGERDRQIQDDLSAVGGLLVLGRRWSGAALVRPSREAWPTLRIGMGGTAFG